MKNPLTSMRKLVALMLCATLTASGCATAGGPPVKTGPAEARQVQDLSVMVEYVQRLSPGTQVRVERATGKSLRGTLMKATADAIVIQPRTRIPEPAVEVPMGDIVSVTPDAAGGGFSLAKAIGAGAAAGAGAALAVFLVLVAIYD